MTATRVGIRELKADLSRYLRRVRESGAPLIVTERGKPVAEIRALESDLDARIQALITLGMAQWSGRKLQPNPDDQQSPAVRGNRTVAELLLEDRE